MRKKSYPEVFAQRGSSKDFTHSRVPFKSESFRLQVHNFTKRLLHRNRFPNDFAKLFRTGYTDSISSFVNAKKISIQVSKKN